MVRPRSDLRVGAFGVLVVIGTYKFGSFLSALVFSSVLASPFGRPRLTLSLLLLPPLVRFFHTT